MSMPETQQQVEAAKVLTFDEARHIAVGVVPRHVVVSATC